ncbi:MAG: XRE family transcriptional regulator [Nigerium sp.]|nr:XRE family transcriptional regulator [Nigerium sp.]
MEEPADFGHWLRVRRKAAGLSQRGLAARTGVPQPTIAAIESGRRGASEKVKRALGEALGRVRPATLLWDMAGDVHDVLARRHVTDPRVFGSVARGDDRPGSDIDLLVHFPPGASILDLLDLEAELADLLTVRVDLVSDDGDPSGRVLSHAVAEAVPL